MAAAIAARTITAHVAAYETAHGPIAPGATVSINHEGCTAGQDTRARLYITRKIADGGAITDVAYCHNCGLGGAAHDGIRNVRLAYTVPPANPGTLAPLALPAGLVPPGTSGFPDAAADFIGGRLDGDLGPWGRMGLCYDRESARFILPIYHEITGDRGRPIEAHGLLGWQARRLYGSGPKYLTVESDASAAGDGLEMEFNLWQDAPVSDCVILVEDWLSAAYVARHCPRATVVPLLRYKISAERLARLRKRFKALGVWLDDDKPEVIATRNYLKNLWVAMGGDSGHTGQKTDPKNWEVADLKGHYSAFRSARDLPVVAL